MKACQPTEEYAPRHAAVLEVLRERASAAAKAEDLKRKKVQRANLSSSEHQSSLNTKVFLKPTREQVDEQWARALIKKGLAIDLVDDKEFRAAVLATAPPTLSTTSSRMCAPVMRPSVSLLSRQQMMIESLSGGVTSLGSRSTTLGIHSKKREQIRSNLC